MGLTKRVLTAADEWAKRNSRNDGHVFLYNCGVWEQMPFELVQRVSTYGGRWEARWWPLPSEVGPCCVRLEAKVKKATRWPMTQAMVRHVKSYKHVALKYGVSVKDLKQAVQARKVLAVLDGERGSR